jgi:hypothetical protein
MNRKDKMRIVAGGAGVALRRTPDDPFSGDY